MKHHCIGAQVPMAHLFLVHVLHGFQNLKGRKSTGLDKKKVIKSAEKLLIDGEIIGVVSYVLQMLRSESKLV